MNEMTPEEQKLHDEIEEELEDRWMALQPNYPIIIAGTIIIGAVIAIIVGVFIRYCF